MKIHGKGGLLDFSKDKLTERNKENSFLDVDWVITELIKYGQDKLASGNQVPISTNATNSSSHGLHRSTSLRNPSKIKKKVSTNCQDLGIYSWIYENDKYSNA